MSLKATTRRWGDGVAIVDLSGCIMVGEDVLLVYRTVEQLIEGADKKILLNLDNVTYVDLRGIEVLVSVFNLVKGRDGKLKLLNLRKQAYDLLKKAGKLDLFEHHNNEAMAARSF